MGAKAYSRWSAGERWSPSHILLVFHGPSALDNAVKNLPSRLLLSKFALRSMMRCFVCKWLVQAWSLRDVAHLGILVVVSHQLKWKAF